MGSLSVYIGKGPKIGILVILTSAFRILHSVYNVEPWDFFF